MSKMKYHCDFCNGDYDAEEIVHITAAEPYDTAYYNMCTWCYGKLIMNNLKEPEHESSAQ